MQRILVTGGTGYLGRELVPRLAAAGYAVRVMSRRPPEDVSSVGADQWPRVEWARADLTTGAGLQAAIADVDTIIHAATDGALTPKGIRVIHYFLRSPAVDVGGTKRLVELASASRVSYLILPSIVGIDGVVPVPLAFYRYRLEAERLVSEARTSWAILRITPFHDLIDGIFLPMARWPLFPTDTAVPAQPIDRGEVAERICAYVADRSQGRLPDLGGPEVRSMGDLAQAWIKARGSRQRVMHIRMPGALAAGYRLGCTTCPENRYGEITWEQWLDRKYARPEL